MAIGDGAIGVGWDVVPESGEAGRIRWGAREINRTRDMAAEVYNMVPYSKTAFQRASGIRSGPNHPNNIPEYGTGGDIYFRYWNDTIQIYIHVNGEWVSS